MGLLILFNQFAPPTTTYTQTASPLSGTPPATVTITYQLNAPAGAGGVTITPIASTVGSFSPTTVTIAAGATTGTTVFTTSYVGTTIFTSTNSAGLTNPTGITFTGLNTAGGSGNPTVNIGKPFTSNPI